MHSSFPQICKDFEEQYNNIRSSLKSYEKNKQAIIDMIITRANRKSLNADKTIRKLFKKANEINNSQELIENAKLRFDLGNPPGKNKSYGDALNWESLLSTIDEFEEFYFISDDKDYYSVLDKEKFNAFLLEEWKNKINSQLKYYKRLSQFLKEKYPEITIASEYEKDTYINKLSNSGSFSSTHGIISSLSEFDSFTDKQVNDIVYSAISNNQIYWIAEDQPIRRFMQEIYDDFTDIIEEEYIDDFIKYYKLKKSD